ncbi:general stress protein [Psychrobacillus sp. L4]|uniref:general stress protein n=1 Tax=Psychrobacillus sp. L4 TaxID=3236892 RepID=UPI0036F1B252
MNIESNRRIEVARSEEEMYEKLELLREQGYAESDIHVISKENAHLNTLNRHSGVSTHEAGSFMDTFKSWFTGEDAVTEGLRKLDLSEHETERYAKEVAKGCIVLYTDVLTNADDAIYGTHQNDFEYTDTIGTDVVQSRFMETGEPLSDYAKEQGFTPSTNEFVNETEGRFDEPQDRFVRGETFATDPYLAKEENHIGTSMQEEKVVQEHRPTINESVTEERKNYGTQSPGVDPNLGPAAFGREILEDEENHSQEQYEEKLERERQLDDINPLNRLY